MYHGNIGFQICWNDKYGTKESVECRLYSVSELTIYCWWMELKRTLLDVQLFRQENKRLWWILVNGNVVYYIQAHHILARKTIDRHWLMTHRKMSIKCFDCVCCVGQPFFKTNTIQLRCHACVCFSNSCRTINHMPFTINHMPAHLRIVIFDKERVNMTMISSILSRQWFVVYLLKETHDTHLPCICIHKHIRCSFKWRAYCREYEAIYNAEYCMRQWLWHRMTNWRRHGWHTLAPRLHNTMERQAWHAWYSNNNAESECMISNCCFLLYSIYSWVYSCALPMLTGKGGLAHVATHGIAWAWHIEILMIAVVSHISIRLWMRNDWSLSIDNIRTEKEIHKKENDAPPFSTSFASVCSYLLLH